MTRYMFGLLIAAVCVGGSRLVAASDGAKPVYPAYQVKVDGRDVPLYAEAVAAADARAAQLHETCLDEVLIGDDASEKAHGLAVERSATGTGLYGEYNQYHWRHALSGGFFSYRLAVGDGPGDRTLVVKYYARERGRRAFDVLVDGTPVRSESLGDTGSPGFVFRETRIPAKLLDGKKAIEVRFVPRAGNTAGGVFGLWLVRPGFGEGAYLFTYFSDKPHDGRSGEAAGLHIAYSRDGLKWTALNDDKPVLVPEVGAKKLMRDPSIARGPDGTFHLVWTTSWHDRIIGHASSKDLIHWSAQEAIPVMMHEPKARNCWAPELTYNPDDGRFYIYWATTIPGADASESRTRHRIYMTSTKDWKGFSKTKLWFDPGFSAIDAALLKMYGGEKKWLMFVKNEENPPEGKNVRTLWLDDLSSQVPTDAISAPITGDWVEGPSPLQVGDAIYLYFDQYTRHCYGAVRSDDNGKTWRDVSDQVQFPKGMRHGTALAVEKSFVDALVAVDAAPTLEEGFVHPPDSAKPHT